MKITKQDIVNAFRKNKWKPTRGSAGLNHKECKCCAIPAIISMGGKKIPLSQKEMYEKAKELSGVSDTVVIYYAFDTVLNFYQNKINKSTFEERKRYCEGFCNTDLDKEVQKEVWDAAIELATSKEFKDV